MNNNKTPNPRLYNIINHEGGRCLVYFPLKKTILETNQEGIKELENFPNSDSPKKLSEFLELLKERGLFDRNDLPPSYDENDTRYMPTDVTLLPTMDCNLRCVYCYASGGENKSYMDLEVGKAAVNFVLANAIVLESKSISITFHGGGEPTVNWKLLTGVVEYARLLTKATKLDVNFSCGTNGVMSEKRLQWFIENIDSTCLSIDGPKDIHDTQRPLANGKGSYSRVLKTIAKLEKAKCNYHFRATVTRKLIPRLKEFYDYLRKIAPRSHSLQLEPMFPTGRALHDGLEPPRADEFSTAYTELKHYSANFNYPVTFAACDVDMVRDAFCGAYASNFVVTPSGHVTTCYEASTPDEFLWKHFNIGFYDFDHHKFEIDTDAILRLRRLEKQFLNECNECIARYHCAGDCPVKRLADNKAGKNRRDRCYVIKKLVEETVLKKV